MTNRFETVLTQLGREIIERAHDLKIHMYRCRGKLAATYELSGTVGSDPFRDGDDDEDEDDGDLALAECKRKQSDAEDMKFIVDLMTQFEREH